MMNVLIQAPRSANMSPFTSVSSRLVKSKYIVCGWASQQLLMSVSTPPPPPHTPHTHTHTHTPHTHTTTTTTTTLSLCLLASFFPASLTLFSLSLSLQRYVVTLLTSSCEGLTAKDTQVLLNIISLLSNHIEPDAQEVNRWTETCVLRFALQSVTANIRNPSTCLKSGTVQWWGNLHCWNNLAVFFFFFFFFVLQFGELHTWVVRICTEHNVSKFVSEQDVYVLFIRIGCVRWEICPTSAALRNHLMDEMQSLQIETPSALP